MNTDTDALAAEIRTWAATRQPHERAAAELLIAHGDWLEDPDFDVWLVVTRGALKIRWDAMAGWADSPQAATRSTTQLAILRLAAAIGADEYKLSRMDGADSELIMQAFATSLGRVGKETEAP